MEVADVVGDEFLRVWSVKEMEIGGDLNDLGYLSFTGKAIEVREMNHARNQQKEHCCHENGDDPRRPQSLIVIKGLDDSSWEVGTCPEVQETNRGPRLRVFAVLIGKGITNPYASQPTWHRWIEPYTMLAMIFREHSPGRFHRETSAILCHCWDEFMQTWTSTELSVGPNPGPLPVEDLECASGQFPLSSSS